MTRNRNMSGREWREPRGPYQDDRFERQDRDDRGWFERAGDEVASWFGDDDAERRRSMDDREDRWGQTPRAYDDRSPRFRDEGARRPYTGRYMNRGSQDYGDRFGPDRAYREDRFDRGSSQRDFTGMAGGTTMGVHDPHYGEWRRRQIDALDRDYDDYRRENLSRFENEFSSWRSERQGKRQMLQTVREHMNVVGSDEEHIGTVDKVRGDNIVLTKNDSSDGRHHILSCSLVDRIEGDRVILNKKGDEAKAMCVDSDVRNRALFERDDDRRNEGPHILERSFSGTY